MEREVSQSIPAPVTALRGPVLPPPIVLEPPPISLRLESPPEIVINATVSGRQTTAVCDPQSTALSSRPEHLNKLKEILRSELKEEEYNSIIPETTPPDTAKDIIDSVMGILEQKVQALGAQEGGRKTTNQIRDGLISVAKPGRPAIGPYPDVFALFCVGVQLFLKVAVDHRERIQIIETAREDIISALGICGCYDTIYISTAEETAGLGESLVELYAAIIIFCMNSKGYLENCGIGASFKGVITDVNTTLYALFEKIRRKAEVVRQFANLAKTEDDKRRLEELWHITTGTMHIATSTMHIATSTMHIATDIQNNVMTVKEGVSRIEKAQELALSDQQREDFRKSRIWLGGLEGDFENDKNQKLHTAGTCAWILDHNLFQDWLNLKASILLISGIPGAGKSVLLSFILRKLQKIPSDREKDSEGSRDPMPPILYFFFKNGNPRTESAVTMTATLIDQFIEQHQTVEVVNILSSARQKSNSERCGNFKYLWSLLVELIQSFKKDHGPVSILIDAVDECSESQSEFLEQLTSWKVLGVRFILTTRPEDSIMGALEPEETKDDTSRCLVMKLDKELVNRDIMHYVTGQIATKKYKKLHRFKDLLVETLPAKSEGMFRYAALMLDQLLKPSTGDVEETLAMMPSGLNNMYVWILEHMSDDANELLVRKTVLLWVSLAFRPITVNEIALAYAAANHDHAKAPFDPSKKTLIDSQDILRICGPLVEVTSNMTLAVTHFSVREFVLLKSSKQERDAIMSKGPLVTECLIPDPIIGHGTILNTCMTQLLSQKFQDTVQIDYKSILPRPIPVEYSITHWIEHAVAVESKESFAGRGDQQTNENVKNSTWQAVRTFLSGTNPSFSAWKEKAPKQAYMWYDTCLYHNREKWSALRGLHVIACFGLNRTLEDAIKHSDDFEKEVECRDAKGASPLVWAARKGHHGIVAILLQKGANFEVKDNKSRSALFWAAQNGHTDVVRLLLEKGADFQAKSNEDWTPLAFAACNGHTDVVKLLLEKGADFEAKGNKNWTPLALAAGNGHTDVVRLLLDKGAHFEGNIDVNWTPLVLAARYGRTDVVKLLLEKGADSEAKGDEDCTPLAFAAQNGHIDVVKLLLEEGADFEAKDDQNCTPLVLAASYDCTDVVKLLLEKGADIEAKSNENWTPLVFAARNGRTGVVKLLLEKGADYEAKGNGNRTPLFWAAYNGHIDAVKPLVEKGAGFDLKDNHNSTPLLVSAEFGHINVVKHLLEKGADLSAVDNDGDTPLLAAAFSGHLDIMKIFLENHADPNVQNNAGETPLSLVANRGNGEAVELLRSYGASE